MHNQQSKRALRALIVTTLSAVVFSCGQSNLIDDPGAATVKSSLQSEPTVTEHDGNPTCADFNPNWEEFKVDGASFQDGTYTSPDGYMTIEVTNEDDLQFDFTTNEGIDAVFVKGGPGGVLYSFDPEGTGWEGLSAARDKGYAISHVSFCYDVEFARIAIGPDDVNEAGDPHVFTVNVEQKIGFDGEWGPVAEGTAVDVNLIPSNGALPAVSSDTCAAAGGGTDAAGECTVTFTSNVAGIVTGRAITDVVIDNATLHVETDGQGENSAAAVKRFVDATIEIGPNATNEVGAPHVFTVTALIDTGNGEPQPVPDGTKPVVTLESLGGAVVIMEPGANTCDANGTVNGKCSVTFTSPSAGTIQGTAEMTVDVEGFRLKRTTNGTGGNSDPALKGFVDARITIGPSETNDVTQSHTFTVHVDVAGSGGAGFAAAPDGTKPVVHLTASNGAVVASKSDQCATTGTVSGNCNVTFESEKAGVITGSASVSVTVDGVPLERSTNGVAPNSGNAVKRYVDAWISISPSGTNGINEQHTFTITAKKDDSNDNGFVNVPDGTTIDVVLTPGGASPTGISDTCATGTQNGQCTVTFTSQLPGTVTGHASMTLTLNGLEITRETNGLGGSSGDVVKTFVAGYIGWLKVDGDTQTELGGATFDVCRTHDYVSSSSSFTALSSPVCTSVTDVVGPVGPSGDQDGDAGQFSLEGLPLGRYTVKETAAPSGYTPDPSTKTVELTIANPSAHIASAFVNTQERPSGCTPGFWKNHTDLWDNRNDPIATASGFTTKTKFNDFFGLDQADTGFKGNFTMGDAIGVGGGGGAKLARHGVAALLNLASGYPYTYGASAADLIAEIKAAYESGTFEPLATNLDTANNTGCLVN